MLGKPHHAPDVSSPVLHYTNAIQRNDLQALAATIISDQNASDPRTISLLDLQRPRTAEGREKRPNLRIAIPPVDAMPPPPMIHTGGYESDGSNLIGIALGSPRLVHRRNGPSHTQENQHQHQHLYQQNKKQDPRYHPALEKPKHAPLQRKPSKWRKIGGLFKHKNTAPNQVRNHKLPGCGGCDANDSPGVEDKGNFFGGGAGGGKIKSCLGAKRKLKAENSNAKNAVKGASEPDKAGDSAPMLEVEIPDAQMERYSVMFGGLLARRSKTMDEVTASKPSNTSPESQRPRRATSPTRSKSPSFTLFPTMQVSKASKVLGTSNIPRGPSSLARSQTLPTEQEQHLLGSHSPLPSPMSFKSLASEVSSNIASNIQESKPVDINIGNETKIDNTTNPFSGHDTEHKTINTENDNDNNTSHPQSPHNPSITSSPVLSPLDVTRDKIDRILSPPAARSKSPDSTTPNNNNQNADGQDPEADTESLPKIEISVARSVSVSKSKKKQVLVPIGPRTGTDRLTSDGRLGVGERKGKTPQVMDGYFGHRPGTSQDVRIETLG